MHKLLEIRPRNITSSKPYIDLIEVDNIRKKIGGRVDEKKLSNAINVMIVYFAESKAERMIIDIDEIEDSCRPAKKMTISEIEKELGYKVEIVREKENNNE